jgi:hypothetical protein
MCLRGIYFASLCWILKQLEDPLHIPDIFDMIFVEVISLAKCILAKSNEQEQRI